MHGVDQEQPGKLRNGAQGYFTEWGLASAGADVNSMARRVLTGMLMSGAFDDAEGAGRPRCTAGVDCSYLLYQAVATSQAHADLARELASSSAVLLKNDPRSGEEGAPPTLPVSRGARVALLGSACQAPFLSASTNAWDAGDCTRLLLKILTLFFPHDLRVLCS